jgi:hypothetical protein
VGLGSDLKGELLELEGPRRWVAPEVQGGLGD